MNFRSSEGPSGSLEGLQGAFRTSSASSKREKERLREAREVDLPEDFL